MIHVAVVDDEEEQLETTKALLQRYEHEHDTAIRISTFNNANEAKDFAHHLQRPEGPLTDYSPDDYQVYAISKQNYTTLYNRKHVDAYKEFYNKYYTK